MISRVFINLIIRVLAILLGVGSQLILAKFVSVETYGSYVSLVTLLNLGFIISKWGLDSLSIKEIAQDRISLTTQNNGPKRLFFFSHVVVLLSGIFFLGFVYLTKDIFFKNVPIQHGNVGIIICVLFLFMPLSALNMSYFRGLKRILLAETLENIIRPLIFLLSITVSTWFILVDSTKLIVIFLISYLIVYFVSFFFKKNEYGYFPFELSKYYHEINSWINGAFFINMTAVFGYFYFQFDTIIVVNNLNEYEAGLYGMASNFTRAITLIAGILVAHKLPLFAELGKVGSQNKLKSELYKLLVIALISSFLIWLCMVIIGKYLLGFISLKYINAYPALISLSLGHVINACAICIIGYCNMIGLHKQVMRIYAASALITVTLYYVLFNVIGLVGGGIALMIGLFIFIILFFVNHTKWLIHISEFNG